MNRESGWGLQESGEWMRKERVWEQGWEYQLHKAGRVKIDNRPEQRGL